MKNSISKLSGVVAAGLITLAGAPSALAVASLFLSDGVNTVTVTDGGAGDSNAVLGVITFNGSLSNNAGAGGGGASTWTVNVTTGISRPVLGGVTNPHMDLNSVDVSTAGGGVLTIRFSDVGFGPVNSPMVASIGGTSNGTVAYSTFYDPGDVAFAMTNLLTTNPLGGPGAFSSTAGGLLNDPSFSLTQQIVITHATSGVSSFDAELRVPESGFTLSLLGGALVGLGLLRRKLSKA